MGDMRQRVSPDLIAYIEAEYYPVYSTFDPGHDTRHIDAVVTRALCIATDVEYRSDIKLSADLVYASAALHDIGMSIERKGHSTHSKEIVEGDGNLRRFFSAEDIAVLGEAVEDHSTSRAGEPRSIYGKIVCDADKDLDVPTSLMRAYDYTKENFPELSEEECRDNVFVHLNSKFGEDGLVRFWTDAPEQRRFAETMRKLADDRGAFDDAIEEAVSAGKVE